jgi:hypothetical protein
MLHLKRRRPLLRRCTSTMTISFNLIRLHRMISWCLTRLSILLSKESEEPRIFATPESSMKTPSLSSSLAGSGSRDTKEPSTASSSGTKRLRPSSTLLTTTSQSSSAFRPEKVPMERVRRLYSNCLTRTSTLQVPIH